MTQAFELIEKNNVQNVQAATEIRPWGAFTILEEGPGYKIKRIEVKPNHRLSLQMHHHRSEHWIVVSGTAKVTRGNLEDGTQEELVLSHQSTMFPVAPCTVWQILGLFLW
jgi:mannose-6-phosphate isomerase